MNIKILAAVFAVAACHAAVGQSYVKADILWTKVIASEKGRQCSWPTVAKTKDGALVVVFSVIAVDKAGHALDRFCS